MNSTNLPTKKEEKLISFKKDQFYTVMVIVAFAVGILTGYFIWGQGRATPEPIPVAAQPAPAQAEIAEAEGGADQVGQHFRHRNHRK